MGQVFIKSVSKNKNVVENSEKVLVNSSPFYCPICFEVFSKTPVILPCGHSFCESCILEVIRRSTQVDLITFIRSYECAICRAVFRETTQLTKNYALNSLLESISEVDFASSQSLDDTLHLAYKRLLRKVNELEDENGKVKLILQSKSALNRNLVLAGIVLSILVVLQWIRIFYST